MQLSINNILNANAVRVNKREKNFFNRKLSEKYKVLERLFKLPNSFSIKFFLFRELHGTRVLQCYRYDGSIESWHDFDSELIEQMQMDADMDLDFKDEMPFEEDVYMGSVDFDLPNANIFYQSKLKVPEFDDLLALEEICDAILRLLNFPDTDNYKYLKDTEWRLAFVYELWCSITMDGSYFIPNYLVKEVNDIIEHYRIGEVVKQIDSEDIYDPNNVNIDYPCDYMMFPILYHYVSQAVEIAEVNQS